MWSPGAGSLGQATGGSPHGMGTATQLGAMVATDASPARLAGSVIARTATITTDPGSNPTIDIAFANLHNLNAATPRDDVTWSGLTLRDGRFGDGTIDGRFYGPKSQELGGVFQRRQRHDDRLFRGQEGVWEKKLFRRSGRNDDDMRPRRHVRATEIPHGNHGNGCSNIETKSVREQGDCECGAG